MRPPMKDTEEHLRIAHSELMVTQAENSTLQSRIKSTMEPLFEEHGKYTSTWKEVKPFLEQMKKRLNDKRKKKGKLGKQPIPKGASNKSVYNPHAPPPVTEPTPADEEGGDGANGDNKDTNGDEKGGTEVDADENTKNDEAGGDEKKAGDDENAEMQPEDAGGDNDENSTATADDDEAKPTGGEVSLTHYQVFRLEQLPSTSII